MNKQEVKQALKGKPIAIIRNEDIETAKIICQTLYEEGIDVLEITYSVKEAPELIRQLRQELPDAIIGAGTVLTRQEAYRAHKSGAMFVVSPCIMEDVADYCREEELLCSLGAMTPTEIYKAYCSGSEVVKLFPGDELSPKVIQAVKEPMPYIEIMPTGGVDDKNVKEWFKAGAYAVGFGGYLTKGITKDNLDILRARCKMLLSKMAEI